MVHEIRITDSRDDSHGENFLHDIFEFDEAEDLSGLDVDRADSAGTFLFSLGNRDTTKDGRFTNLRQSNERIRPSEIQAASKTGHFGDRSVSSVGNIHVANRAGSGFQNP